MMFFYKSPIDLFYYYQNRFQCHHILWQRSSFSSIILGLSYAKFKYSIEDWVLGTALYTRSLEAYFNDLMTVLAHSAAMLTDTYRKMWVCRIRTKWYFKVVLLFRHFTHKPIITFYKRYNSVITLNDFMLFILWSLISQNCGKNQHEFNTIEQVFYAL